MGCICEFTSGENTISVFSVPKYSSFEPARTSVHMHHVYCTGDEESLFECPHNGVGIHDCDIYDDAAVECYNGNKHTLLLYTKCDIHDFRLIQPPIVKMEMYVWLMEAPQLGQLKCATVVYGAQYAIPTGITMTLELSADNLDCQVHVRWKYVSKM